jgi:hypothetical protein
MKKPNQKRFESLRRFYPFYLMEHSNSTSKLLHFIGTSLLFLVLFYTLYSGQLQFLWLAPVFGYGFAWIGHFFFEKNKPATFDYPMYSFASDFMMYFDILRGKVKI